MATIDEAATALDQTVDSIRALVDMIADDANLWDGEHITPLGMDILSLQIREGAETLDVRHLLTAVDRTATAARDAAYQADQASDARDAVIREAVQAGASVIDVADAAGLHRQRVYQIRDGR